MLFIKKLKFKSGTALLLLWFVLGIFQPLSAQAGISFVVGDIPSKISSMYDRVKKHVAAVTYRTYLKTFLGRMAADVAEHIATSGPNQTPLFDGKGLKGIANIASGVAIDFVDDLGQSTFGQSICSPSLDFSMNLNLGIKDKIMSTVGKASYGFCRSLCEEVKLDDIMASAGLDLGKDVVKDGEVTFDPRGAVKDMEKIVIDSRVILRDRLQDHWGNWTDLLEDYSDEDYYYEDGLELLSDLDVSINGVIMALKAIRFLSDLIKLTETDILDKQSDYKSYARFLKESTKDTVFGENLLTIDVYADSEYKSPWDGDNLTKEHINLLDPLKPLHKYLYCLQEIKSGRIKPSFFSGMTPCEDFVVWRDELVEKYADLGVEDFSLNNFLVGTYSPEQYEMEKEWLNLKKLVNQVSGSAPPSFGEMFVPLKRIVAQAKQLNSKKKDIKYNEVGKKKITALNKALGDLQGQVKKAQKVNGGLQACIENCFRGQVPVPACGFTQMTNNLKRARDNFDFSVDGVSGKGFRDLVRNEELDHKEKGKLLQKMFLGGENSISMWTKFMGEAHRRGIAAEEAKKYEALANDLKAPRTPVSNQKTAPKMQVQATINANAANATKGETIITGDLVADTIGVFATTLISKLIEKERTGGDGYDPRLSPKSYMLGGGKRGAQLIYADLAEFTAKSASDYNLLEQFYNCNDGAPIDSYLNCTIELGGVFQQAISNGLTLNQFLNQEASWGSFPFVSGEEIHTSPSLELSSLDNLKKLRWARVIPVGWEIAWQENKALNLTFREIVDCFEENQGYGGEYDQAARSDFGRPTDCDGDPNTFNGSGAGDNNPFYNLVDPDWLLIMPKQRLVREGASARWNDDLGHREIGPVDLQSCLFEDSSGNCQVYGYCVREKNIWQFDGGQACPVEANTCTTYQAVVKGPLADVLEPEFNYLASSFEARDRTECQPDDAGVYTESRIAGCRQYYPKLSPVDISGVNPWKVPGESDLGFYFNSEVKSCDAENQGCTEVLTFEGVDALGAHSFLTETQVAAIKGEEVGLSEVSEPKTPLDLYKQKAKQWLEDNNGLTSPFGSTYQTVLVDSVSILASQAAADCKLADATDGGTPDRNLPGPAGCQVFTPQRSSEEKVVAKLKVGENKPTACPLSCDGLGGYGVLATKIEQVLSPGQFSDEREYLIPHASEQCSASAAGCEEFTVVNRSGAATRLVDNYYLTDFQRCLASYQADQSAKYTSFQTEAGGGLGASSWQLLASDSNNRENSPPCTKPSYDAQGEVSCDPAAEQEVEDCQLGLAGCRQYTSAEGKNYWRFENQVVPVTDNCTLLKRSATGLPYRVNLNTAGRCQAAEKSCRAYISPEFGNFTELLQQKGCLDVNKNNLGACFAGAAGDFSGWRQSSRGDDESLNIETPDSSSFTKAAGDFEDPTGFVSLLAKEVLSYQFSAEKRASLSSGGSYRLLLEVTGSQDTKLTAKLTALGQTDLLVETELGEHSTNVQELELVFAELDFIPQSLVLEFDQAVKVDNIRLQQIAAGSLLYLTKDSIEQGRSSCLAEVSTKLDNDEPKWGTVTDLELADQCLAYDEIKVGVIKDTWPQVCKPDEGGCQSVVLTKLTMEIDGDPDKGVEDDSQITLKPDPIYGYHCSDEARGCSAWGLPTKKVLELPEDEESLKELVKEVYLIKDPDSWDSYSCRYGKDSKTVDKYDGCLYYNEVVVKGAAQSGLTKTIPDQGQFLLKDPQYLGNVYQYQIDEAGTGTWQDFEGEEPTEPTAAVDELSGFCIVGDPAKIGKPCTSNEACLVNDVSESEYPESFLEKGGYCLTGVGQCQPEEVDCQQVQVRSLELEKEVLPVGFYLANTLNACPQTERGQGQIGLDWQCLNVATGWGKDWAKKSPTADSEDPINTNLLTPYKLRRGRQCGQWLSSANKVYYDGYEEVDVLSLRGCQRLSFTDSEKCLEFVAPLSDQEFNKPLSENYHQRETSFTDLEYSGLSSPDYQPLAVFGLDQLKKEGDLLTSQADCRLYPDKYAPFKGAKVQAGNMGGEGDGKDKRGFGEVWEVSGDGQASTRSLDNLLKDLDSKETTTSADYCSYTAYTYQRENMGSQFVRYLPLKVGLDDYSGDLSKYSQDENDKSNNFLVGQKPYLGQAGYCLDWLEDEDVCLNWYPIDKLEGQASINKLANATEAGVRVIPDLAYCEVAQGGRKIDSDDIDITLPDGQKNPPIKYHWLTWLYDVNLEKEDINKKCLVAGSTFTGCQYRDKVPSSIPLSNLIAVGISLTGQAEKLVQVQPSYDKEGGLSYKLGFRKGVSYRTEPPGITHHQTKDELEGLMEESIGWDDEDNDLIVAQVLVAGEKFTGVRFLERHPGDPGKFGAEVYLYLRPWCQRVMKPITDGLVFKYVKAKKFKSVNRSLDMPGGSEPLGSFKNQFYSLTGTTSSRNVELKEELQEKSNYGLYYDNGVPLKIDYQFDKTALSGSWGAGSGFKPDQIWWGADIGTPFVCVNDCLPTDKSAEYYQNQALNLGPLWKIFPVKIDDSYYYMERDEDYSFNEERLPQKKLRKDQLFGNYQYYKYDSTTDKYSLVELANTGSVFKESNTFGYYFDKGDAFFDNLKFNNLRRHLGIDYNPQCPVIADTEGNDNKAGSLVLEHCDILNKDNYGHFSVNNKSSGLQLGVGSLGAEFKFEVYNENEEQLPLRKFEFYFKNSGAATPAATTNATAPEKTLEGYFKNYRQNVVDNDVNVNKHFKYQFVYFYDEADIKTVTLNGSDSNSANHIKIIYNYYYPLIKVFDNWGLYTVATYGSHQDKCNSLIVIDPASKYSELTTDQKGKFKDELKSQLDCSA